MWTPFIFRIHLPPSYILACSDSEGRNRIILIVQIRKKPHKLNQPALFQRKRKRKRETGAALA